MNQVFNRIRQLSQNDHEPHDIEDYIYLYKDEDTQDGNRIPRNAHERNRRDCWVRIRATLRNNMLRLYTDPAAPNKLCYEVPVHLHGYHVLVRQDELMEDIDETETLVSGLFLQVPPFFRMFTLVTYYRMFTFAVEGPEKMVQWISRFGYTFCCYPKQEQLCFSYCLPPGKSPGDLTSSHSELGTSFGSDSYPSTTYNSGSVSSVSTSVTTLTSDISTNTSTTIAPGKKTFFGRIRKLLRNTVGRLLRTYRRIRARRRRRRYRRDLAELQRRLRHPHDRRHRYLWETIRPDASVRQFLSTITIAPHCHCMPQCMLEWSARPPRRHRRRRRPSWTPARFSFSATMEPRPRSPHTDDSFSSVINWLVEIVTSILFLPCRVLFRFPRLHPLFVVVDF